MNKNSPNVKNEGNNAEEIDLLRILRAIGRKWWLILIISIIGALIALICVSLFVPNQYSSEVCLYVNNRNQPSGQTSVSSADISASRSLVQTYLVILMTDDTMQCVIDAADLDYTPKSLKKKITGTAVANTEVFSVSVTTGDPEEAYLIAKTIGEQMASRVEGTVENTKLSVVQEATLNLEKVAPSKLKYTVVGFAIGCVFCAALVVLVDWFDNTIRNDEIISKSYNIPILAKIPDLSVQDSGKYYSKYGKYGRYGKYGSKYERYGKYGKYGSSGSHGYGYASSSQTTGTEQTVNKNSGAENLHVNLGFARLEAYKLLRTNLMFMLTNDESHKYKCPVIGVTSSIRGEGKSTTSVNLAYTVAEAGYPVLLIDGDMRLPSIGKKMEIDNAPGLSNALVHIDEDVRGIVQTTINKNWFILPCGDIPPNPSEMLGSSRMKKLLAKLSEKFAFIIVDLPPVDIVSDALALSSSVDGLLVAVRENYTDFRDFQDCVNQLDLTSANVYGFVMTCVGGNTKSYSKYGKKYGSKYYSKYYEKAQDPTATAQGDVGTKHD